MSDNTLHLVFVDGTEGKEICHSVHEVSQALMINAPAVVAGSFDFRRPKEEPSP